jgi:hypothetical protein
MKEFGIKERDTNRCIQREQKEILNLDVRKKYFHIYILENREYKQMEGRKLNRWIVQTNGSHMLYIRFDSNIFYKRNPRWYIVSHAMFDMFVHASMITYYAQIIKLRKEIHVYCSSDFINPTVLYFNMNNYFLHACDFMTFYLMIFIYHCWVSLVENSIFKRWQNSLGDLLKSTLSTY